MDINSFCKEYRSWNRRRHSLLLLQFGVRFGSMLLFPGVSAAMKRLQHSPLLQVRLVLRQSVPGIVQGRLNHDRDQWLPTEVQLGVKV